MIDTILVAVDDSRAAFRAAEVAVELADRLDARLVVVSVVDGLLAGDLLPGGGTLTRAETAGMEHRQLDAVRAAQRHVAEIAARAGVEIDLLVSHGHVADALLDQARSVGAKLIVIGRVEPTGVRLTQRARTAEQVLEFSEIPVVVVPAPGR